MKTRIFSALAFVIPCLSLAQPSFSNYDTIPARYRGYHYTEWYDQCPAYNNGGVIDSCSYEIYTLGRYVGEAYAKYEYTDHPIKIKGLAAMVHNETRATNFPHPNPAMAENYLYLLERIDWVDTVHPDRLGYFRMRIIDSVRFDTVKPKIMVIEQAYPGIPPSYAFVYEAYFDKPITIDSIFYIHGSFSHILNHDTDVYTHWPFDYTAVVPLKRWLSCGDCCPRNGLCQPEGQNRSLEYIDRATIYDPGYPALDTNEVWCMGWHYDPNEPFGLFFAIVDHYELKLFSDSLIMGTVEGSGFYDENDTAVFQAIPNPGFVFYQWNDGNMQNPRRLQLSHDTSFTAIFAEGVPYHLSLQTNNSIMGTVSGEGDYPSNSIVTISATPSSNAFLFSHWNDGNTNNPRTFTLSQDTSFTAIFTENWHHHVDLQSNNPQWGSVNGDGDYLAGSEVTIIATPKDSNYAFSHWNDYNTSNPRTFTITQDTSFTANFYKLLHINPVQQTYNFSIFPNPTSQTITLQHNDNGKHHVDIFDSKGLLVKSIDYSGSSIEIDLSSLPNGTYYIRLTYNGMQGVRTIVKH